MDSSYGQERIGSRERVWQCLFTQQHRMVGPLAGIAQRFAEGKQTVDDDAVAIRARLMKHGAPGAKTENEWLQRF